jgi:hypothetical protein
MTMGELRLDTAKAARFSASTLSTGAFDALPPTQGTIYRCLRRPKRRSSPEIHSESGECRIKGVTEQLISEGDSVQKPSVSMLKGKIDFAILTVVQEEHKAVLDCFPNYVRVKDSPYLKSSIETADGRNYNFVIVRCLRQGTDEAQEVTRKLRDDLDPKLIILVGIAGGVPCSDFGLGDVVCASEVQRYESVKYSGGPPSFDLVPDGKMNRRVECLSETLE